MRLIEADKTDTLDLGRVGENNCTQVIFAAIVQRWLAEYPGATIGLVNRPSRQGEGYPVGSTVRAGQAVIWTVQSADLAEEGWGECQLFAMEGETIVKSEYWRTRVLSSLDGSATPPEPWKSWQAALVALKDEAQAAAQDAAEDAEAAASSASSAGDNATAAAGSASAAETAKTAAQSAQAASESAASSASASASGAAGNAAAAAGSAENAAASATAAGNSATAAAGSAANASASATAAAGSAADAQAAAALAQQHSVGFEDGGTGLILKPIEQEV